MAPGDSELPEDFIDTICHGVRTPLMVITTNAQLLRQVAGGGVHADLVQRSTADIARSARRLLWLLDDLVDFYRLGKARTSAATTLQPIQVSELLALLADEARGTLGEHELTLEVQPALPRAIADALLLGRSIRHLVANAASYSAARMPIVARASAADGRVSIDVVDRGPGISAEDQRAIFEPFRRLAGARGGVGLGLYLVKRFVEAMNGQVSVASTLGAGSTFTVTLPAA